MKIDKRDLFRQLESNLDEQIARAEKARQDAQDDANKYIGRMQSRYDTFKEEAQQMAAAHELRKLELNSELTVLKSFLHDSRSLRISRVIRVGNIVILESLDGQTQKFVFIAPAGGGTELVCDTQKITVITPTTPLGQMLLGKVGGEKIELELGKMRIHYAILEVL